MRNEKWEMEMRNEKWEMRNEKWEVKIFNFTDCGYELTE